MAITFKLVITLFILFVINFYLIYSKNYSKVFILMFAILILIPPEIISFFSGSLYSEPGKFNISLIGYDVLIAFVCFIIIGKGKLNNIPQKKFYLLIILLMLMFMIRIAVDKIDALSNKMVDNYLTPILFAILIIAYLPKEKMLNVFKAIYTLILFNAIIACIEYIIGQSLFFHEYYMENVTWYRTIYNSTFYNVPFRCTALLGHPLTNGMYYMIAVIYLFNITNMNLKPKHMVQAIILFFSVFATNSRMDIAVLLTYTVYKLIKNKKNFAILGVVLIIVLITSKFDFNDIYSKLFNRDSNGTSLAVRLLAINSIFKIPIFSLFFGTGYNNTSVILKALGFSGNLEISYFIILLENGIIGFAIWMAMIFIIYTKKMEKNYCNVNLKIMVNEMICCFAIIAATSNSIGDPGTLNYLLWGIIAFSNVATCEEKNKTIGKEKNE